MRQRLSAGGNYYKFVFSVLYFLLYLCGQSIRAARYSEGLNRWSFFGHQDEYDLNSDLLCPDPMTGGMENRIYGSSRYLNLNDTSLIINQDKAPTPNDIWALKTNSDVTYLPCALKPFTHKHIPYSSSRQFGRNYDASVENKILFMNLSLVPFDFAGATVCSKFIKLQFDEEDGVDLTCDENTLGSESGMNHIYWPKIKEKRKRAFSISRNLRRLLQNEDNLRKIFFFQIYFTSKNGQTTKCTVQQYALNLANPGCNSRRPPRIENVCGEFSCNELIFPYYEGDKRVKFIWKSNNHEENGPVVNYAPGYEPLENSTQWRRLWSFGHRRHVPFVMFITLLSLILFGVLIFSLEIVIHLTCLRRSRDGTDSAGGPRSQQILQNSLNLWETIPSRDSRSVSFSPVTTNIDMDIPEQAVPDSLSTPRVLKSALKKSTENLPPPPASFFEDREYPPPYCEAMKH